MNKLSASASTSMSNFLARNILSALFLIATSMHLKIFLTRSINFFRLDSSFINTSMASLVEEWKIQQLASESDGRLNQSHKVVISSSGWTVVVES